MRYFLLIVVLFGIACKSKNATTASASKKENKRKILTGAIITGITITSFPKYGKDGEEWDAYAPFAGNPDLFVLIDWNGNNIYKSEVHDESLVGTPLNLTDNFPVLLKAFDQNIQLEVFDEDGISSNDNVGYFSFKPIDYQGKSAIELKSGELAVTLTMNWTYQ